MTQIIAARHHTGAYLVSDSLYVSKTGRTQQYRKVFRYSDDLLLAASGHAAGAQMVVDVVENLPGCDTSTVREKLKELWVDYEKKYRGQLQDQVLQSFFLLSRAGPQAFELLEISAWPGAAVGYINHDLMSQRLFVFGPARSQQEYDHGGDYHRLAETNLGVMLARPRESQARILQRLASTIQNSRQFAQRNQGIDAGFMDECMTGWALTGGGASVPVGDASIPGTTPDFREISTMLENLQK